MNQQAQQNVRLWRQVLRADLLNTLWWVLCTLEKQIKALLNTQNSARGTNVLPQQPTTSLAPAVLCSMCGLICMYLDYYTKVHLSSELTGCLGEVISLLL